MDINDQATPDTKGPHEIDPDTEARKIVSNPTNALEVALQNYVPGTPEEQRLVRKVDLWMIPMLWWMCVLCYIDRNNIVRIVNHSGERTLEKKDSKTTGERQNTTIAIHAKTLQGNADAAGMSTDLGLDSSRMQSPPSPLLQFGNNYSLVIDS